MKLGLNYNHKVLKVHPEWQVGVYPLDEKEKDWTNVFDWSTQGNHGTATALTPHHGRGADGKKTAPLFGTGSYIDLYSAGIASDLSFTEFSVAAWCKVLDNSVWSDSTVRRILTIGATATTNVIILEKTATDNTLRAAYVAASTTDSVSPTVYESLDYHTQWFHFGMTLSVIDDELKVYLNGAQTGTTQTTFGSWTGSLASTICVIGAANTSATSPWSGWLQHVAVWNETLSAADFAYLYDTGKG
jgi:hypothetical protein